MKSIKHVHSGFLGHEKNAGTYQQIRLIGAGSHLDFPADLFSTSRWDLSKRTLVTAYRSAEIVRGQPREQRFWWSSRPRDTHICCLALGSGAVTTYINDLGLSRPGFEHPALRMKGEISNQLRHHWGQIYSDIKARVCYGFYIIITINYMLIFKRN